MRGWGLTSVGCLYLDSPYPIHSLIQVRWGDWGLTSDCCLSLDSHYPIHFLFRLHDAIGVWHPIVYLLIHLIQKYLLSYWQKLQEASGIWHLWNNYLSINDIHYIHKANDRRYVHVDRSDRVSWEVINVIILNNLTYIKPKSCLLFFSSIKRRQYYFKGVINFTTQIKITALLLKKITKGNFKALFINFTCTSIL